MSERERGLSLGLVCGLLVALSDSLPLWACPGESVFWPVNRFWLPFPLTRAWAELRRFRPSSFGIGIFASCWNVRNISFMLWPFCAELSRTWEEWWEEKRDQIFEMKLVKEDKDETSRRIWRRKRTRHIKWRVKQSVSERMSERNGGINRKANIRQLLLNCQFFCSGPNVCIIKVFSRSRKGKRRSTSTVRTKKRK